MSDNCTLTVNVCSARNIAFRSKEKINILVQCTVGKRREKTTVVKNCGPAPMWNQQFSFKVKRSEVHTLYLEVKHRERFNQFTIGVAHVSLPDSIGVPVDSWISLKKEKTQKITNAAVHIIYQLDERHTSSSRIAGILGSSSKFHSNSNKVKIGKSALPSPSSASSFEEHGTLGKNDKLSVSNMGKFEGHVAAGFLNDVITSLEEVKSAISKASGGNLKSSSAMRVTKLKQAKKVLAGVENMMKNPHSSLSDSWIENISKLIKSYKEQLGTLYETHAWNDVSMRLAESPFANTKDQHYGLGERLRSMSQDTAGKPKPPPRPPRKTSNAGLSAQHRGSSGSVSSTSSKHIMEVPRSKTRKHALVTLEEFDSLVDEGMAIRVKNGKAKSASKSIHSGDTVEMEYESFIWDPTTSTAIEYASSVEKGPLQFIVGNEDVPQGLDIAIRGLTEGTSFVCTIAPHRAYGDDGSDDGVPPNSHIVFDGTITSVSLPSDRKHIRKHSDMPVTLDSLELVPLDDEPEDELIYPDKVRASVHLQNMGVLPRTPQERKPLPQLPPRKPSELGRTRTRSRASSSDTSYDSRSDVSISGIEEEDEDSDDQSDDDRDGSSVDPFSDVERSSFGFSSDHQEAYGDVYGNQNSFGGRRPPDYSSEIDDSKIPPPPPQLPIPPPLPHRPNPKEAPKESTISKLRKHSEVKGGGPKSTAVAPTLDPKQLEGLVGELKRLASMDDDASCRGGSVSSTRGSSFNAPPKPTSLQPPSSSQSAELWLNSIGLSQYAEEFTNLGVDAVEDFQMLEADDLTDIQMKPIHHRKLIARLRDLGIDVEKISN